MNNQEVILSIVTPVYGASPIVNELVKRIHNAAGKVTEKYEIILVEDASPDDSWNMIEALCKTDSRIKGIRLSRNFGQHNALSAGLQVARGEQIVVMDCDLQDNPDYIPELYREALKGFDIVYTMQEKREHSFFKNLTAFFYYKVLSWISSYKIDPHIKRIGIYSMINKKVLRAFLEFNDYKKAYLMVLQWLGFSYTFVNIKHEKRLAGKSSYTFFKLLLHAIDYTIFYSDRLLYLIVYLGLFFSLISVGGIFWVTYNYFTVGAFAGWSSVMVTIIFFGGFFLLALGTVGIYIAKIFEQTKNRPRFVVRQTVNLES